MSIDPFPYRCYSVLPQGSMFPKQSHGQGQLQLTRLARMHTGSRSSHALIRDFGRKTHRLMDRDAGVYADDYGAVPGEPFQDRFQLHSRAAGLCNSRLLRGHLLTEKRPRPEPLLWELLCGHRAFPATGVNRNRMEITVKAAFHGSCAPEAIYPTVAG